MKKNDLSNLDRQELLNRLEDAKNTYFTWKEAINSGKESNHAKLKTLKREIATVNTVLAQKNNSKQ